MSSLQLSHITVTEQNTFLFRSGKRQRCSHPPLPFNIVWEVLAFAINQEKEINGIYIRNAVKMSLFTYIMIIHVYNLTKTIETSRTNK